MREREPHNQSKLDTANEMYKAAFEIIRTRFRREYPDLPEPDLTQKVAEFMRDEDKSKKS